VAFDASHNYSSASATVNTLTDSVPEDPTGLSASMYSGTQINLTWTAPSSGTPHHYRIWRRSSSGWTSSNTTTSTSYSDTSVSAGAAYLYKVSAENSSNAVLGFTNMDLAITIYFTDATLTVDVTPIKAAHITDLRTAVNAVRAAAGISTATWTDSSLSGISVKAIHVTELRSKLAEAISALGLPAVSFTDSTLTANSTVIKKTHIEQLRQAME
jgi:fibronectin type 3 domain-containing protein